jgi:hypothetical protein
MQVSTVRAVTTIGIDMCKYTLHMERRHRGLDRLLQYPLPASGARPSHANGNRRCARMAA